MALSQITRFGKYQTFDILAQGGMATLYRGKNTGEKGFEKLVAIKKIHPHLASEEDLITSFIDEAKLAALLQHENIVTIYDFGNMDGSYCIVMEYLFGKDLSRISEKIRKKDLPLSLEHALYITSRVCAGLDYAHKLKDLNGNPLNIIHRDISPHNILITYDGNVKIVDFGIAKAAGTCTMTQTGIIKGKIAYMSPEQAQGKHIDLRSDIFATGILLYEMVTGQRMFDGTDTLAVLHKVSVADFEPIENIVNNLPPEVYKILGKALARDPDQRYQTDDEMLTAIEYCMHKNSLRPNARGLKQYMKMLFEDVIAVEEQDVRNIADKSLPNAIKKEAPKDPASIITDEDATRFLQGSAIASPSKPGTAHTFFSKRPSRKTLLRLFYGAAGLVAMAIVAGGVLFLQKKSSMEAIENIETMHTQAMVLLKNKDFAEAANIFKQIIARDRSMTSKMAGPLAQALQGQALKISKEDMKKARSLLLESVDIDPGNAQCFFHLGVLHAKLGSYPDAIEAYEKSSKLNPDFSDSFFNLAYLYALNKNYAGAEAAYSRVVELAPQYLDEALFNLAIVQDKQGKRDACRDNIQRALIVNPNNETARGYLSKMN